MTPSPAARREEPAGGASVEYKTIKVGQAGGIATITLNRPENLNAFDFSMGEEVLGALQSCGKDDGVRVVVLGGEGRAFSAGGDVKVMASFLEKGTPVRFFQRLIPLLHPILVEMTRMPKPVIGRVHGFASGYGMSLVLGCDLVVAGESTRFNMAYVLVGLAPDGGSTFFMPRLVGPRRALEMFFTGDAVDAREAERLGIVNRVVPDSELEQATQELAAKLAQGAPLAMAEAKRLVYRGLGETLERQLEDEREAIQRSAATQDFSEGVSAFVEKRRATFRGR
jgi:2-(1,2-epoxy-1,2-dihydrophenyl)acetyl-CoA isomerase